LPLPDMPQRPFLYPFEYPVEEFTFIIPFNINHIVYSHFFDHYDVIPAMFLACVGDNWEIYLNGTLVKSELYLKDGKITTHLRENVFFPFQPRLLREGVNVLTFRIVGDPTSAFTGFYYTSPYYITNYIDDKYRANEYMTIAFVAIYFFMGLFHLFRYFLMKNESYNLYYAVFSILLGFYFTSRSGFIYSIIPDSGILRRIELCSVFILAPSVIFFIEKYCRGKLFFITKCWGAVYFFMALLPPLFSIQFSQDLLFIWQLSVIPVGVIVIIFDWVFLFEEAADKLTAGKHEHNLFRIIIKTFLFTPTGNILIGVFTMLVSSLIDIFLSMIMHKNTTISRYGFFVLTMAMTFLIAKRFTNIYNLQERIIRRSKKSMNTQLVDWIMVKDKDPEFIPPFNAEYAILFTDIRNFTTLTETAPLESLFKYLRKLNESMAQPMFKYEDSGYLAYTDKLIGDSTMNVFENPTVALKSALEFRTGLKEFNKKIAKQPDGKLKDVQVEIGCGLSFGHVIMGLMGHSRRLDYTALGDTVNLASRLEGLTKTYRMPVLFDEELYSKIKIENFTVRHIDKIRVKNRKKPVNLYEEFSGDNQLMLEIKSRLLPRIKELQYLYFSGQNWKAALKLAKELQKECLVATPDTVTGSLRYVDYLPFIYYKRMRSLMTRPHLMEKWDGVYTFTHK